jgi:hypothetical protein
MPDLEMLGLVLRLLRVLERKTLWFCLAVFCLDVVLGFAKATDTISSAKASRKTTKINLTVWTPAPLLATYFLDGKSAT